MRQQIARQTGMALPCVYRKASGCEATAAMSIAALRALGGGAFRRWTDGLPVPCLPDARRGTAFSSVRNPSPSRPFTRLVPMALVDPLRSFACAGHLTFL